MSIRKNLNAMLRFFGKLRDPVISTETKWSGEIPLNKHIDYKIEEKNNLSFLRKQESTTYSVGNKTALLKFGR